MQIAITHITTACVLLEIGPLRILTDPVFDTGERRYRLGPAAYTTRRIGPSVELAALPPIDALLLSHSHHLDNLDDSGLEIVRSARYVITGQKESERAGTSAIRLSHWESAKIAGTNGFSIDVTSTPGRHGPWWFPGSSHVSGFILHWPGQKYGALYISGDTIYFGGLRSIAKRFKVGTALLHMGGVHFWPPWPSFLRFTFTGRGAARCTKLLDPHSVIPIHYEQSIWTHFRESLESYKNAFRDAGVSSRVRWLPHGVRTEVLV